MFTILESFEKTPRMMRETYCDTLIELAKENQNIIVLDADLVSSS